MISVEINERRGTLSGKRVMSLSTFEASREKYRSPGVLVLNLPADADKIRYAC